MLIIILNAIIYLFFRPEINKFVYVSFNKVLIGLTNSKIRVHGNTNNFSNNNLLIMSNHYDGVLDGNIIYNLYYKHNSIETLHTIVKSNIFSDPNSKQKLLQLLYYIKNAIMSSCYFIPYKRGDKEDGKNTRNIITNSLQNGKNILVFPEGTSHKNGIPKEFKKGTFELAVENKLRILPITIKYEKDIGTEKGDPDNFLNIFDNTVDIYIHDVIDETDKCYQTNDPIALKNKVFNIISAPMLV
jgi:1-acyl-sn-glycerol-3-phosphate acyltransferase